MSYRDIESMLNGLPWLLKEQVLGYAHSVENALTDIYKDAKVTPTQKLTDQMILIAGIRKLHDIVASNYWALDNSGKLLSQFDVTQVRAGSADLSRGGTLHKQLERLLRDLNLALAKEGVLNYMDSDYASIASELSRQ